MSSDARMPAPATSPPPVSFLSSLPPREPPSDPSGVTSGFTKQSEVLSPTSAAAAHASEQRVPKPGEVTTGSLRIKVVQVSDLSDTGPSSSPSSSWLRYSGRKPHTPSKPKASAASGSCRGDAVCVLLRMSSSTRTLSTSAAPRADAVVWNEEFLFENVTTKDELKLVCIDRTKNEPYSTLPLRGDDSTLVCTGFIGKVNVPLIRLPDGEEIEQWYSLVPKDAFLSLRTALRVSICFTPAGGRVRSTRAESTVTERSRRPPPLTMTQQREGAPSSPLPPPSPKGTTPQAVTISTGIIDYAIIVGPQDPDATGENVILFRYPEADRPGFALPTKVEWFCFPGGPEVVEQVERPRSKVFSFVLVGGTDGLSRVYAVCVMLYHRARGAESSVWHATCVAFLTRVPLLNQLTTCLLSFTHAWLASAGSGSEGSSSEFASAEQILVNLCHGIPTPVRGVFGVEFALPFVDPIQLILPTDTTIHHHGDHSSHRISALRRNNSTMPKSPTKSPSITGFTSTAHLSFQPVVYSLEVIFQQFDIKTVVEIVALMLCEFRILVHSSQMSVLCPVAEGLCALIHPFRWQHPYVPILPSVLSEYLQAPLPYILGVNSSWLPDLLENGRPEHLVIIDVDRGSIQRQDTGPMLPPKLTRVLRKRVNCLLYPSIEKHAEEVDVGAPKWTPKLEELVRGEFVSYMATMLRGYRECLFFVNQKLPVFNKRRFFASYAADNEASPFLTRLFSTQAFQAFLENHDAAELSVFHAAYAEITRGKEAQVWPNARLSWLENRRTDSGTFISQGWHNVASTPLFKVQDMLPVPTKEDKDAGSVGLLLHQFLDTSGEVCDSLRARSTPFFDTTAMGNHFAELMNRTLDYHDVAKAIGVDSKALEEHKDWLKHPHEVNQYQIVRSQHAAHTVNGVHASTAAARSLSRDEERVEQLLHKCLTSVFTSDDQLTGDDVNACETRFKNQYARDLFVLILMQPSQQYAEALNSSVSSAWYDPKGSGSCIGESGFQLLVRLASTLLDQCSVHEDFTNARGMLQVAAHFYHFVDDKHSGVLFAKKEYLVQVLRVRPICRSLDMWQHAFSREIDAMLLSVGDITSGPIEDGDAPPSVSDEVFFSVIGSLVFDMLTVDVPVANVQTFVTVMCSTYQKDREMRDTLKQLVENVFRAVELSKDSPPHASLTASTSPLGTAAQRTGTGPTRHETSPHAARSQYDLDTVIRRKMSVQDAPPPTTMRHTPVNGPAPRPGKVVSPPSTTKTPANGQRGTVGYDPKAAPLCSHRSSVLSLSVVQGRVACGWTDPLIAVLEDTQFSDKKASVTKLEGHTDAVVAVHIQGLTLVSASRDQTLRVWDLKTSPKKRHHLFGFLSSSSANHGDGTGTNGGANGSAGGSLNRTVADTLEGAAVSRKCVVMKGHSGPITCLEIGRQLSTDRAIVASGSMDASIRLWDTSRESSVAVLSGGNGGSRHGISTLRYLPQLDFLVSGVHNEFTLKAWDIAASKMRSCVQAHRGCIRDIQVTGDRLVTAANDRVAKVWDARFRDGHNYSHALRGHGGPVLSLSLGGPADPNICTGSADGIVRVWDLRYVQKGPRLALQGHLGSVTCLQRDFTRLVSGSEDGSLRLWDMHSGMCLKEVRAHQSGVTCMVLRDASVYSGSWDGTVRHWDLEGV